MFAECWPTVDRSGASAANVDQQLAGVAQKLPDNWEKLLRETRSGPDSANIRLSLPNPPKNRPNWPKLANANSTTIYEIGQSAANAGPIWVESGNWEKHRLGERLVDKLRATPKPAEFAKGNFPGRVASNISAFIG